MAKIDEVARAAGVSISTVSYALSGKRPVSRETRERIESAVRELGYRPNAGARMLAGSRTQILALTEPLRAETHAPTHMAFVLAATIAARRQDYDILLLTDEEAQAGMNRVAASGLVDGILVLDVAHDDARVALARSISTPSVFIGVPDDNEGLICVDLDFEEVGRRAVDRLADAGHERIGLVGQSELAYRTSNFPRRLRRAAVERAAERGVTLDVRTSGATTGDVAAGLRALDEFLAAGVTAIVLHCPPEVHAAVVERIADRGLVVPRELSLIGAAETFDTSAHRIPVDAMPLDPQASCDRAVALALEAVAGVAEPGLHLISPQYLDRGSVAAPPPGGRD